MTALFIGKSLVLANFASQGRIRRKQAPGHRWVTAPSFLLCRLESFELVRLRLFLEVLRLLESFS